VESCGDWPHVMLVKDTVSNRRPVFPCGLAARIAVSTDIAEPMPTARIWIYVIPPENRKRMTMTGKGRGLSQGGVLSRGLVACEIAAGTAATEPARYALAAGWA
jgi:hypothetical protein